MVICCAHEEKFDSSIRMAIEAVDNNPPRARINQKVSDPSFCLVEDRGWRGVDQKANHRRYDGLNSEDAPNRYDNEDRPI